MTLLGAVLAGGRSTRFGSDKALALLDGRPLIDHAIAALSGWCDAVVVVGRAAAPVSTIPDVPAPGMGPMGGIVAALLHAAAKGHDTVLTIPVDAIGLPDALPDRLSPAPAFAEGCPVIGLWPTDRAVFARDWIDRTPRRSVRAFGEAIGARAVALPPVANVNTAADLARIGDRAR